MTLSISDFLDTAEEVISEPSGRFMICNITQQKDIEELEILCRQYGIDTTTAEWHHDGLLLPFRDRDDDNFVLAKILLGHRIVKSSAGNITDL